MHWTHDKPTSDGYYWLRVSGWRDRIVRVKGERFTWLGRGMYVVCFSEVDAQWSSEAVQKPGDMHELFSEA